MTAIWRAWRAARGTNAHPAHRVQLLSTPHCGLCREARTHLLAAFDEAVDVIDITGRRDLEDAYLLRVPVVLFMERVLAEGEIGVHEARIARIRRDAMLQRKAGDVVAREERSRA